MSNPAAPTEARAWSAPGPRRKARRFAVGYIGLVLAIALAYELAGRPSALDATTALMSFPGTVLVLVALVYPLVMLLGDSSGTEETGFSLLTPLFQGAGALANVLIVWGVLALVRHFRSEAHRSRDR
ncbi:hypothetical protein OG245_23115 [Streptomyces sp. NBC_01116]|uniref:hypothetical protein n=1 Tax=Streptomyces sp. NBC_01116 TaxID=2903752 RepID=UPI00324B40E1